jgi:hypothetical protein
MSKIVPLALVAACLAALAAADDKPKRSEAEKKALEKIQKLGGLALELAQNDPRLEVSYQQAEGKFTDAYLVPLKDLKDLVHLNLRGQPVSDKALEHLKGITTLTRLHLEKTKITDKGTENLKGLVNLEYLNLYGTEIGDATLAHLEGMKKLKNLYLWQTKVTDAGVAKLQKALPKCDINRGLDVIEKPKDKAKDKDGKDKPKDKDGKDKPKDKDGMDKPKDKDGKDKKEEPKKEADKKK